MCICESHGIQYRYEMYFVTTGVNEMKIIEDNVKIMWVSV